MTQAILPSADPIPLPAPFWLLKLLLVATFFLHIVAMNVLLGGGLLALAARVRSGGSEQRQRLFSDLVRVLPVMLAATITLGVAPLLFLQVLYGQFFYAATIIIGWPWFLILIYLVIAYYGLYLVSFKHGSLKHSVIGWLLLISVLLLLLVGFMYTNGLTLMGTPESWPALYAEDPGGWNLNLSERTLVPRFLHFVVGAIAVAGLFTALMGAAKLAADERYGRFLIRFGSRVFFFATLVEFAVGMSFFASLPPEQITRFSGASWVATGSFGLGILTALAAMVVVVIAVQQQRPFRGLASGATLAAITLLLMIISRESMIDGYLAPHFDRARFSTQTQWDVLTLFAVLFAGGLVLWGTMMRWYFKRRDIPSDLQANPSS